MDDVRSLRRWLVVLGVIAVAAIGLAAYAIAKAGDAADEEKTEAIEQRLSAVQLQSGTAEEEADTRQLARRVRGAASKQAVAQLDRRLRRVERDAVDAVDASADTGRALRRLQRRVDRLKRSVDRLERIERLQR